MASESLEIVCSQCGAESILLRKPVYENFTKTGERLFCASCGHEYGDIEDVQFKKRETQSIFDDIEAIHTCRRCAHYVVNPFTQRCGLHEKEVEATDVCDDFKNRDAG